MKRFRDEYPLNYRQTELSISVAYELIWGLGNNALCFQNRHTEEVRKEVAKHIGFLFTYVGQLRRDNDLVKDSSKKDTVLFGQLLAPFEEGIARFENDESDSYNCYENNDYFIGLRATELYLNLSYIDLKDNLK